MNRYILSAAIIISTIACNNSNDESGSLPGTQVNTSTSQTPANSNTNLQPQVSIQPQPGTTTQPATTQTTTTQIVPQQQQVVTTATPAQTQQVAKGMNPEHGKPGHRCDIPVGAPLNSAPQQKTSTTTAQVVQPTTTTNNIQYPTLNNNTTQQKAATTTTTTAPGMNPAHGQPGHRCDIAVGAPLNSKPATQTQTVDPNKTIQLQPTETKKDSTKQ
jgi:hypothetical protein